MPRVDGLQLLKKIRNHDASIPVYLISGLMLEEDQLNEIYETADGFLRKPFTIDEIQAFINNGMKKRDLLKKLAEVVPDNKILLGLIKGKVKVEKLKEEESIKEAGEILELLKAS